MANRPIFPKKLFKWLIAPMLILTWTPVILLELLITFHDTERVENAADAGVIWIAGFAFPALVLSAVLVGGIMIIRLIRRAKTQP